MAGLPTGTVTFLFTDIEGSTKLWEQNPEAMRGALVRHDEILREAIEAHGGYVVKPAGDGFHAVFSSATHALEAALEAQRALLRQEWAETGPLRVRMALHTGAATEERDGDYFGPQVNRAARLLSAGHGGQVLLSLPTQELVRDQLPEETTLRDLGERRLKDLFRPERVFQLIAPYLPSEFPSLKTLEDRPNNLPLQPTPLVGREQEAAEVAQRLLAPETRLLSLTGPGGIGKTRLALQAAAELLEEFEDGAYFVSLAALTDPELVASAIAAPLGAVEAADRPLEERLKEYLREKKILLLLDNFEQVLEGAQLVGQLLAACPGLKILATSRISLGLYGEREYPVPPLSLPDPKRLPSLERLTRYEAIKLFIERARDGRPDFSVTNENAPAVAEICARLDGLPLAIELAASRVKVLPPQKMLDKLSDRLKLLTGGARDLPKRQRTLRNALDWSYELLDEGEKTLFGRLGVFSGGATLEAVEAICDAGGDLPVDVLDGVESLVDKSLLRQEERVGGEPRFVMLETIHEYAREKLEESGEAEEIKHAHALYFLALAEEAEPELKGPDQLEWFERLEADHDNLREALSWSFGIGDTELGLRLAGSLGEFWYARGHYREGNGWLEGALASDGGSALAAARAKALEAVGWLANERGDIEGAEAAAEEGLTLSAQAGIDSTRKASFLRILGATARIRGDHERANELYEESLALSREARDRWGIANSLVNLGSTALIRGDHERAKELYEEGLILSRELGGAQPLADFLINMGYTLLLEGDHERATALNEEAAALLREQRYHQTPKERALREPYLATARSRMEEAEWAEGRTMSLEVAISYALGQESDADKSADTTSGKPSSERSSE